MKFVGQLIFGSLLMLSSGCDSTGAGDEGYPSAMDWPEVSLAELKYPNSAPANVNVVAYVILIFDCPEEDICEGADGLLLSETMYHGDIDWNTSVTVDAEPSQFRIGSKYRLSIRISGPSGTGRYFGRKLEGYDTIFSGN